MVVNMSTVHVESVCSTGVALIFMWIEEISKRVAFENASCKSGCILLDVSFCCLPEWRQVGSRAGEQMPQ